MGDIPMMKTIKTRVSIAATLLGTLGLTACVITEPGGGSFGPGGRPQPGGIGIEGNWSSQDGGSVATFQNGAFTNRAVDTGQSFTAGGRYTYLPNNQVAISYTSVVRQEQVDINCLVATRAQMNCTTASGAQFQLFRRA